MSPKQTSLSFYFTAFLKHSFYFTPTHKTFLTCSSLNTLLRLYIRDRTAYLDLRQSGMIGPMPCPQTLGSYKNRVAQITGINNEFLQWMSDEARALNVTSEGRIGGLVIDEMSIQV